MLPAALCLAAAFLLLPGDAARILGLFPHTGRSHQMVFEPLLRTLAERGHHVTVVSFFPLKNPPANYTDVSLEGIAPIGVETFDLAYAENPFSFTKVIGIDGIINQILGFSPLGDMAVGVCEKLVSLPALADTLKKDYDVVLVENFNSDCMLGLVHVYGVDAPVVAVLSSGLMPYSGERIGVVDNPSYVPTISTQFTDRMSFTDRLENTFMFYYLKYFFSNIQRKEQDLIERHFGRKIVDLDILARNISLMMANTFHSLNGIRPMVPGLIEVGGMHLDPTRKSIPDYLERFLNESEEGVILLSFGSLIKTATIPPEKEAIIVSALASFRQRVIWKYEGSGPEGNLTGNILRVNWIPQYELLHHRKVIAFIAHGGLLGMSEAMSAGKPMVVVPFFGDQPRNGITATAAGLATVLSYADLTEQSMREAVQKVLSATLRLNARRASRIWHDRQNSPLQTAVYWTERVARWGYTSQLYSTAREIPFYQMALLDVIAAVILAISLVLFTIWLFIKSLLKAMWLLLVKEPKKKTH